MANKKSLEFTVDLTGAKNENDVIYRFYKVLRIFPHVSEAQWLERVCLNNHPVVWAAFYDNIARLDGCSPIVMPLSEAGELEKVTIYLEGYWNWDLNPNLPEGFRNELSDVLLRATDKTNAQVDYDLWVKVRS